MAFIFLYSYLWLLCGCINWSLLKLWRFYFLNMITITNWLNNNDDSWLWFWFTLWSEKYVRVFTECTLTFSANFFFLKFLRSKTYMSPFLLCSPKFSSLFLRESVQTYWRQRSIGRESRRCLWSNSYQYPQCDHIEGACEY